MNKFIGIIVIVLLLIAGFGYLISFARAPKVIINIEGDSHPPIYLYRDGPVTDDYLIEEKFITGDKAHTCNECHFDLQVKKYVHVWHNYYKVVFEKHHDRSRENNELQPE
jgi:hypothetical protein